jgi:hypothetical protein
MDDDHNFSQSRGDSSARCSLLLDVTMDTLRSDPDLRLCEGLRLIEAARTAILRLDASLVDEFEASILPKMKEALMDRFGIATLPDGPMQ